MKRLVAPGVSLIMSSTNYRRSACSGRLWANAWVSITQGFNPDGQYGIGITYALKTTGEFVYTVDLASVATPLPQFDLLVTPSQDCTDYSQGGEFYNRSFRRLTSGKYPV
jgi:hypothetical protein